MASCIVYSLPGEGVQVVAFHLYLKLEIEMGKKQDKKEGKGMWVGGQFFSKKEMENMTVDQKLTLAELNIREGEADHQADYEQRKMMELDLARDTLDFQKQKEKRIAKK